MNQDHTAVCVCVCVLWDELKVGLCVQRKENVCSKKRMKPGTQMREYKLQMFAVLIKDPDNKQASSGKHTHNSNANWPADEQKESMKIFF